MRENFVQVDATNIGEDEYTLNWGIDEENMEPGYRILVEFKELEADSKSELEKRIEEKAQEAVEESEFDVTEEELRGYELMKQEPREAEGVWTTELGFAVVPPNNRNI